ncbi:hypothetical protein O3M35_009850 [Rhynocoris fuscipes]|uniref:Uncharacterized protein n=1 Tax=Rhynocoris fuscipes TaxID=488301 RepID=A0AAW1D4D1_9HEMI
MKVGEDVRYRGGGGGGGGGGRQDSRRRFDPAYTPDIAHLVHRGSSLSAEHEAKAKSARARLAEVLSLTRTASRLRQATQRKQAVSTGSVDRYTSGYQQSSLPSSKSTERSTMPSSRLSLVVDLGSSLSRASA